MTLIIGVEDGARSFLVCDSGSWRGRERHVVHRPKIWRDGEWIVGCSGNMGDSDIARTMKIGVGSDNTEVLRAWANVLQKELNEQRRMIDVVDPRKEIESGAPQLIAARGGAVYHVHLCEVTRSQQGFTVAGQHGFGYGAMHGVLATCELGPLLVEPIGRALIAMSAAYRGMDTVFGPIVWLGTDGTEGTHKAPSAFEYA